MGITSDLERLAELHRSGALSDAEFASAKARALGDTPRAGADAVAHWLHALRRSRTDRWLGGVSGGLAPATGLPSWLWRLIFALLVLCGGTGAIIYLLLWILVPNEAAGLDVGTGSSPSTSASS
jgi:phage shock protein C